MTTESHVLAPPEDLPASAAPLRVVTAASLFDGHDAAINVMRRLIQDRGAEVVHLGHNRSVDDVVRAAIQEDADAIAISSYQGGHTEYFRYVIDMLREVGAPHIRVFGGGGGTITLQEIAELQEYGVERIYHPHDGMSLGLAGMIDDLIEQDNAQASAGCGPGRFRRHRRPVDRTHAVRARERRDRGGPACLAPRATGASPGAMSRSSASRAPAAPARARSPTSCCRGSCSASTICASPWSPSIRRAAGPGAHCSATGSG